MPWLTVVPMRLASRPEKSAGQPPSRTICTQSGEGAGFKAHARLRMHAAMQPLEDRRRAQQVSSATHLCNLLHRAARAAALPLLRRRLPALYILLLLL